MPRSRYVSEICPSHLRLTEMNRISEALQLAIIIERSWAPPVPEAQLSEKLDFLWRRVSAERTILEKCSQARFLDGPYRFLLNKFKPLQPSWSNSPIQDDLQAECREIDV